MKVIIAGGRDFNDAEILKKSVEKILGNFCVQCKILHEGCTNCFEIVSGKAKGADTLGEEYANSHGLTIKHFPADWAMFGGNAGYVRNTQMANYADALIAFWDGKSSGTKDMINKSKEKGLIVNVLNYQGEEYDAI